VRLAELGAPKSAADRDNVELGVLDGTADGRGNLLGALGAEAEVPVVVTDGNERLGICVYRREIGGRATRRRGRGRKEKERRTVSAGSVSRAVPSATVYD